MLLRLEIDDDYDDVNDPNRLIPLAACNRCAELRVRRGKILYGVREGVLQIIRADRGDRAEVTEKLRPALRGLLQSYLRLARDWKRGELPEWDEAILDMLLFKPVDYGDVLRRAWETVKAPQQTLL
jgi:hypothetical protein